jgi:adenylate cyclase
MDCSALSPLRMHGRMVDLQRGSVTNEAGHLVTLRPQTAAVLKLLAARPGTLVTKDELMQAVWGSIAVTDDSLVQCIADIRKALGDEKHEIVKTVLKRGYMLETGAASVNAERHISRRWLALAAACVIGIMALTAAYLRPLPEPVAGNVPSIAVLPFDDMSADKSLAYMGDGVAEDIISMLARAPDVMVIARNSSFTYKDRPADIRRIGSELGVDYVLEGSVRKEADKLRIVAQLNDTKTGEHLWAERFDKTGPDPWALQDEVTGRIISSLTGELGQMRMAQYREAWGKDTANLAEYDYFLRGLDIYINAGSKAQYDRASRIWREGLAKYPDSSLLKAKLGWYHWSLAWDFFSDDIPADFGEADRFVSEVLATENLAPEVRRVAHWLNAFVLMRRGDFERSVVEAEFAVAMAPYDARMLRSLCEVLAAAGRYEMALGWLATAETREPGGAQPYHQMRGYLYRLLGKYEESAREYALAQPLYPYHQLSIAIDYIRLGRLEEAKAQVRRALRDAPDFTQVRWREGSFYSDPAIIEGEIADLAKVGLPEK